MKLEKINSLKEQFTDSFEFLSINTDYGELTIEVKSTDIFATLKVLKENFGFEYLADICATDLYTEKLRFEILYNLTNLETYDRIRVKCRVDEGSPKLDSVTPLWHSANWHEREAYDMMGIIFEGNPDLRRMFMPEDYEYFPLRKEFPLIGIPGSIQMPEKDPPKPYK